MRYPKLMISIGLILQTLLGLAQPKMGQISGKLRADDAKTPLEYATISVFDVSNNTFHTGGVTDKTGAFQIEISCGQYKVLIESLSFKTISIEDVQLTVIKPKVDLGVIDVHANSFELEAVEVIAEKSRLQFGLDKKTFNVGKDLLSDGGSILDVLDNIPSISVDPQGRISLRGSQSVKVLIDGKPTAISSAKLLQNFQSSRVQHIEIITNPSSKYDAEGLAGIINVVLKKEKKIGISGSLSTQASFPNDYAIGLSLNRNKRKINLFTNIGLRHWRRFRDNNFESIYTLVDSSFRTQVLTEQIRRSYSANINIGLDYQVNDQSTLTSSFLYDIGHQPHDAVTFFSDFDQRNQLRQKEVRTNDEKELEYSLEYLLQYERKFAKKGQKLETYIKYIDNSEDNHALLEEFPKTLHQRTSVKEMDQNLIVQADYTHPLQKQGKMEMGIKNSFRNITNQFLVEENRENQWLILKGLSNDFQYQENIYAAYISFGRKKNGFSYQLGLRGELTDLRTALQQTNVINDRKPFLDFFPSLHLGYKTKNGHSYQLSYSRRIERPSFNELNPFFSFTNDRFITTGNPNLNPMYTHAFELGYMKSWETTTIGSSIYSRFTNNFIDQFITIDEQGVSYTKAENLGYRNTYGLEFSLDQSIKKWLKLDWNFNFWRSAIKTEDFSQNLSVNYTSWMMRFGARVKMPWQTDMQVRYFYRGLNTTVLGTVQPLSRLDLAVRKKVLKGKGRLSLSVKDLLYQYQFQYMESTPQLIIRGTSRPWQPTVSLSFQYRWR